MARDVPSPAAVGADTAPESLEKVRVASALRRTMFGEEQHASVGRFELRARLGGGGMGVVFSAHDPELDRLVAIKVLSSDLTDASQRSRLRLEAQAMAKLNHPNVATVHEVGTHEDQLFVAMELIDGQTLRQWSEADSRSWREVLDVYLQAGDGLVAAHEAGLVHRDFKPDNVMIGNDGRVRVLDFGLVSSFGNDGRREADPDDSDVRLTQSGTLLGTPAYMSAEQLLGKRVDARSDQCAFCVALFEALYGHRPFAGDTVGALRSAVERGEIVRPKTWRGPGWLRAAIVRGLSTEADARWPSMSALVGNLRRGLRRRRLRRVLSGIVVVAGGGVTAAALAAPPPLCGPGDEEIAGVWDDEVKARLVSRYEAAQLSYAAPTFAVVAGELDEHAADWRRTWDEACGHDDDPRRRLRELDCLAQSRQQLGFYASALGVMPIWAGVERPDLAIGRLLDPIECTDPKIIRAVPDPPATDEAQEVEDIRAAVLGTYAIAVQNGDELTRVFEPIIARAEPLSYPVLAEVLVAFGQRLVQLQAQAAPVFERAIEVAQRSRHDRAEATARISLAHFAISQGDVAEVSSIVEDAEVAVARAGNPLDLDVTVLGARARVAKMERRFDDVYTATDSAISRYRERYGADDIRSAPTKLLALGAAVAAVDMPRVGRIARGLRSSLNETVGPGQPGEGLVHHLEGLAHWASGDREAAEASARTADAVLDAIRLPDGSMPEKRRRDRAVQRLEREIAGHRCRRGTEEVSTMLDELAPSDLGFVSAMGVMHAALACSEVALRGLPSVGLDAIRRGAPVRPIDHISLLGGSAVEAATRDDPTAADAALAEMRALAERTPGATVLSNYWTAMVHVARGDHEGAWRELAGKISRGDFTGAVGRAARRAGGVTMAELALELNKLDEAASYLGEVMPRLEICCADEPIYARGLFVRAQLRWTQGDHAAALVLARQAVEIAVPADGLIGSHLTTMQTWVGEHDVGHD